MAPPRHLWSGDWTGESARAAEELARRRAQEAALPAPVPVPVPASREPAAVRRQGPPRAKPAPAPARTVAREPVVPWRERLGAAARALLRQRASFRLGRARALGLVVMALAVATGVALTTGAFSAGTRTASSTAPLLQPRQPWIGLRSRSSPAGPGVVVTQVVPGGPAEQAGLQPGDVVTAVNAGPILRPSDIAGAVDSHVVGDEVLLQIYRGGQLQTVGVTLARRPAGVP